MADLLDAAKEVDGFCRRMGWPHCVIGGMALLRWGEQRFRQRSKLDWTCQWRGR